MTPAPRAVVVLAVIALAALLVPLGLVAIAALMLVVAVVVDARAAKREPQVERQAPEVLSRGIPAQITIRAPAPAGGTVRVRQPAPPELTIEPREGDGGLTAEIVATRRGRHTLPAVATRATGPLGLARWDHRRAADVELRVFPDLKTARRLALAVARGRFRDQGATARGPLGLGTEFELIRDYQPDDDIRQVNWRATARLGRPMSNQYRLEQDRDLQLLIDAGRLERRAAGRDERARRLPGRRDRARVRRRRARRPHRRRRLRRGGPDRAQAAPGGRAGDRARALRPAAAPARQRLRGRLPARRGLQALARRRLRRPAGGDRRPPARRGRPGPREAPRRRRRQPARHRADRARRRGGRRAADRERRARRPRAVAVQLRPAAGARVLQAPPEKLPATVVAAYLRAKARAVL